jgi:hypothetical protein
MELLYPDKLKNRTSQTPRGLDKSEERAPVWGSEFTTEVATFWGLVPGWWRALSFLAQPPLLT